MGTPGSKLVRIAREKGPWEIGRRALHNGLSRAGTLLLRCADRFTPDHTMALSPEDKRLLESNREICGLHSGKRCFVLGNGPSIKLEDLLPLADEITFVMNRFYENPIIEKLQPTYYCLSDSAFFDGSDTMTALKANQLSVPNANFFVPLHFRQAIEANEILPPDRTRYILFRGELRNGWSKEIDLTGFVPGVWNVCELCIMVAIYMGCSPIYLLGLDHDWLAHRSEYGQWQRYSYKQIMEYQQKIWCGYESLSDVASRKNVKIVNATKGSFLDVFEFADYHLLVDHNGQKDQSEVALPAIV
jgi:hypothetical protein